MTINWQSRIVGHEKVDPATLKANPLNHRLHPKTQRDVVRDSINEIGFIKSVTVNKLSGLIVDGHERVMQALESQKENPDLLIDVEFVELTPSEEAKALAVLDASSELAEVDPEKLKVLMNEIETSSDSISKLLDDLADIEIVEEDNPYTDKQTAITYEITGVEPTLDELLDMDYANKLIQEIENQKLPNDVAAFLTAAAYRHARFNFSMIAEYYAHANKDVQTLMENSALVIVDIEDAIQNGWTTLNDELSEQYASEYGQTNEA